jgi:hypothetical protein
MYFIIKNYVIVICRPECDKTICTLEEVDFIIIFVLAFKI